MKMLPLKDDHESKKSILEYKYYVGGKIWQCHNCQVYGHHEAQCRSEPAYGQCAGTHATLDCRQEIVKCARCDGPHRARIDTCSILREEKAKVECARANPPKLHPEPGKKPEEIELEGGGAQSREFAGEVLGGRDWRARELSLSTSETFRPSLGNGRASSAQGHIDSQGNT